MIKTLNILFAIWLPFLATAQLQLNEICPSNQNNYEDPIEGFADWIEVYNNSGSDIDLEEYYLSDDPTVPTKWNFPEVDLVVGEYRVFAADELSTNDTTIQFNLVREGMRVYLFDEDANLIDSIIQPKLRANHSYGRLDSQFFVYENPTPNAINSASTAYKGYAQSPIIETISGNYDPFHLPIESPSDELDLWYIINGDMDVIHSYESPLSISETISIMAFCTGDSLLPSAGTYRTFFVHRGHELNIIHLFVDSTALFDETIGIYSEGPDAEPDHPHYGANYWKDTSLVTYYEYFNSDFELIEALECELRIHGGTISRTRPMKSLRLVARNRFDQSSFNHQYFKKKDVNEFRRLLLRNSGSDYNITHLKDGILHDFALHEGFNIDVQAYLPVVVYINGEFIGVHNLREKLDAPYLANNHQVNPDSVNLLEEEELFIIDGDSVEFRDLGDFVEANDLSIQANFDYVEERIDLESMVDYFIYELFLNNRDWPYNNLKLWNAASQPRYRYLFSDLDAAIKYYGSDQLAYHSLETILGTYGENNIHCIILKKLLDHTEFRRYFINRYADLMNTSFQADYILDYIYNAKSRIEFDMNRHFGKWYGTVEKWNNHYNKYDTFFEDRVDIVRNELSVVFDLPEAGDFYLGVYPANAGIIQCNTIELTDFPFVGQYYDGNAIDLTAEEEYQGSFLYWKNLRTGETYDSPSIQINPEAGDSLIAIFGEKEDDFNLALHPNPVFTDVTITFDISESGPLDLEVYNLQGQRLMAYHYDYLAMGGYQLNYDFSELVEGSYLVVLNGSQGREGSKFVKL
ncbi:MAG: CotH kinase family protein [Flavobacteriales bacterium]|nr:CotH kinase family protein [Flavobacteriales bacterium]